MMASRKDPVSRARGRTPAAPVKKPFPVGFVVGSVVLTLFLVGILAYAAKHQGIGDRSSLAYAESQVDGLQIDHKLPRNHVENAVAYPNAKDTPPYGGDHNPTPQTCQVYKAPIQNEHAVHSMEHGAVWVTYNPDTLSKADLDKITKDDRVEGNGYVLVSPYPGLKSKLSLQAWGERVFLDSPSDKRFDRFLELFTQGPQTKEPGAACTGVTTTVTPTPAAGASATPAPSASTAPSSTPAPAPTKS